MRPRLPDETVQRLDAFAKEHGVSKAEALDMALANGNGRTPKSTEIGHSGLIQSRGYIIEEFHPALRGDKASKIYEEMEANDATVHGMRLLATLLARQVTWEVQPGEEDSDDADEAADFVDSCLHDMSIGWADVIGNILTFVFWGWSYHEIVYKRRTGPQGSPGRSSRFTDGKIGWRKIAHRAQASRERWEIGDDGAIEGLHQNPPTDGYRRFGTQTLFVPIEKALLFRVEATKNNPEPHGILRRAYRSWYMAKRIEEIEAIGIERDLAGLPVIYLPAEIQNDPTKSSAWKQVLRNIRRGEADGALMPSDRDDNGNLHYELTLLSSGGERQFDTNDVVGRHKREMARAMLADFIFFGEKQVGSYALADSRTNTFAVAEGAYLDVVCDVFNRHAIPRLLELNGMPLENPPKLTHGDIETPDLEALGNFLSKLTAAGMPLFPDPEIENYFREHLGLPPMTRKQIEDRKLEDEQQAQQDAERQQLEMDLLTNPPPRERGGVRNE
jgi:hypothetical protein